AADVTRRVGCQEGDRAADFRRLTPAPDDGVPRVSVIDVGTRLDRGGERRLDDRGRDRVDANPVASYFGGKALDEQRDRGLGRAVDREPRLDGERPHRRRGDDASASLLDHDAADFAKEEKRSLDVEVD